MTRFIFIPVEKWITPPQASSLAAEFQIASQQVKELANNIRKQGEIIHPGWVCPAKDIFFSHFDPCLVELNSFAQQLESAAENISSTKVKIYVEQQIEVQD